MELGRAREVLLALRPTHDSINCEVEVRDWAAHLRMNLVSDPARWVVVYTSGATWSSLEVDGHVLGASGRFSLDCIHEDEADDHVEERLQEYVALATTYLLQGGEITHSKILGLPQLAIGHGPERVVLARSVAADLRALMSPRHWIGRSRASG
ncbi:MAG: hypothetical protein ACRDUV_22630 [Pseudonocardiaceae bacterium]